MNIINLKSGIDCKDHDGYKAITTKELMWSLSMQQHELVYCNTPDGPSDDFSWKIILTNWFTGSVYELNSIIVGQIRHESFEDGDYTWYENGRIRTEALIEKMKAKGKIDLTHWTKTA